ncbi:LamB/YcsF family [Aureococcus anophagefferens]|nr:LamB/YcsF family [Aureococcus anophagefferens]
MLAPAASELLKAAEEAGLATASEVFADRAYMADGTLAPRAMAGSVIHDADAAIEHALRLASGAPVKAFDTGEDVVLRADSICVHGDKPSAVAQARASARASPRAAAGGFRAYVEFPDDGFPAAPRSTPSASTTAPAGAAARRTRRRPAACAAGAAVFARVAGVDRAAYGLDAHAPLLFANGSGVLVAAAALSNVTTGRSAPADAWRALWSWILGFPLPAWRASVAPAYAAAAPLPASHAADAVARSARWISDASG